jgi:hypothetical protein
VAVKHLPRRALHAVHRRAAQTALRRLLVREANPPVLLTSIPKCGTHLLRELFRNTPGLNYWGSMERNEQTTAEELHDALAAARGMWVVGHVRHRPELHAAVRATAARVVMIMRDPRGYAVSLAHHIRRFDDHVLHEYFKAHVPTLEEAIASVIRGVHLGPGRFLPDVTTFYGWYLPWSRCAETCTTQYAVLVGPRGGGTREAQRREVAAILAHVGFSARNPRAASLLASTLYHRDSPTFRQGTIRDWERHFTPALKETFKEVAGQLLIDLGYESDLSW